MTSRVVVSPKGSSRLDRERSHFNRPLPSTDPCPRSQLVRFGAAVRRHRHPPAIAPPSAGPPPIGAGKARSTVFATPPAIRTLSDHIFQDAQGHHLALRTHLAHDKIQLCVYDRDTTPALPDRPTTENVGHATLQLERNRRGYVTRVRLEYIEVAYAYRTAGVGSKLLETAEAIGRICGATEIYGQAPNDETTRRWYARRRYGFRNGGEELYKTFWRPS